MGATEYGLFLNGRWETPSGANHFTTTNPTNQETVGRFVSASAQDVLRAVTAAHQALPAWRGTPSPTRGELLRRVGEVLRRRKEELGRLVTTEMGKVIAEGRGDVQESIDFVEYMAGEGRRLAGETVPSEFRRKFCMTIRQPKGVVACITPWNFPTSIPNWKIAAALLCGNTVVFKPSSQTASCAAEIVRSYEEAGVPPGVLNFVTGAGGTVGEALAADPRVRAVSFTGGVDAGREVYTRWARELKPVHLELGGKNPMIVLEDANLDLALDGLLFGAFGTAGQRCTATSRLLLHERVYDEFLSRVLDRLRKFRIGDPLEETTDMGPVASADQERKVRGYFDLARTEGDRILHGGEKLSGGALDRGFFLAPTVVETRPGSRIATEEVFGPLLAVLRIRDYEEGVRIANETRYGLSSSIYTCNVDLAFRAVEELEAGITYVNAPTIGAEVQLPFGGIKNTGNGGREAGSAAIEEFTEIKSVFVDFSGRLQRAQIDHEED